MLDAGVRGLDGAPRVRVGISIGGMHHSDRAFLRVCALEGAGVEVAVIGRPSTYRQQPAAGDLPQRGRQRRPQQLSPRPPLRWLVGDHHPRAEPVSAPAVAAHDSSCRPALVVLDEQRVGVVDEPIPAAGLALPTHPVTFHVAAEVTLGDIAHQDRGLGVGAGDHGNLGALYGEWAGDELGEHSCSEGGLGRSPRRRPRRDPDIGLQPRREDLLLEGMHLVVWVAEPHHGDRVVQVLEHGRDGTARRRRDPVAGRAEGGFHGGGEPTPPPRQPPGRC